MVPASRQVHMAEGAAAMHPGAAVFSSALDSPTNRRRGCYRAHRREEASAQGEAEGSMVQSVAPVAGRRARMPSLLKTAGWALLFWAGAGLVQEFNRKGIPEAVVLLCFLGGALAMMRIWDRPAAGENAA